MELNMSYGENLLEGYLNVMVLDGFVRNLRPAWLCGLELDFFFPERRVGLEFQGDHHYVETCYSKDLAGVRRRDSAKRAICKAQGIKLIRIDAIDLWWPRLRHKLKPLLSRSKPGKEGSMKLRALDHASADYRKTLNRIPVSVTAKRRSKRVPLLNLTKGYF